MARHDEARDDVELGDMENEDEAFIPKPYDKPTVFTRWMPSRLRNFLYNLSRIKIVLILLVTFILLLLFLGWIGGLPITVTVPPESVALSKELSRELDGAVPDYILNYAPLVFLDRSDQYLPSDLATHVLNTHPAVNFTEVKIDSVDAISLQNLHLLNDFGGENHETYLTSTEPLVELPKYLQGTKPDPKTLQTKGAMSCVIIVVGKDEGRIIDAFYMYFYTFNQGPSVVTHEVGDHLGDWEHSMIRFEKGEPKAVWYSQHEYGEAYSYAAVQKAGKRPIVYSAKGSHANYATSGKHDLSEGNEKIPPNIVWDHTSPGPLWDPTLSAYYYTWSAESEKFTPVIEDPSMPVNYLYFNGKWGDQEYTDDMRGQEKFHDLHKWTGGPEGPLFKHLDRKEVCLPNRPKCEILEKRHR